jgi:hypothetical protein
MFWVGFKPTIPALERAKTLQALDRAATVIGRKLLEGRKCRLIQVLSENLPEGTEKNHITSVRVAGAPDETGTECVPDTSVQSCRYVSEAASKPVKLYQTTRRYIPEDSTLYGHRCWELQIQQWLHCMSDSCCPRSNNDYIVCLILVAPDPTMITLYVWYLSLQIQ